jgi:lysophospholipase L1-like esterase
MCAAKAGSSLFLKMKIIILLGALLAMTSLTGLAQPETSPAKASPPPAAKELALAPVTDDPKLPRVLLIGDSISIGYTLPVRKLLGGKANVHRPTENGGPTTNGLSRLSSWLGGGKWDVIHFNWGLHDLKFMADGQRQVSPEAYEQNLRELVRRLQATGAKLIWASTTPVPDGKLSPVRNNADVLAYNAIAGQIMREHRIAIDDLYGFAQPQLSSIQRPANVHFTAEGSAALARQVAASIEAMLSKPGAANARN